MFKDAYRRGEEFSQRLASFKRPLYLMAHHDDEMPTAGLLQRLGPETRVVWVTNSDGLYFESDMQPAAYGEVRKLEGLRSVGMVGIPKQQTRCLDFSEVEIYRRLSELYSGKSSIEDLRPFFGRIREAVRKVVLEIEPDAVFTLAWQGGQPEHDLTHFFCARALDDLERRTGRRAAFFQLPAYEYTILVAMRFNPLYRGVRIRLRLDARELDNKLKMVAAYPSQVRLFGDFKKLFRYLVGPLGLLSGGPTSADEFMAIEEFGPVPEIDYTRKPHRLDYLSYMFDDFEGVPVTFSRSVLPVVRAFL
ncbi:MAG TPA: PIG-L family deacetylase [Myxococcota bacterium]|nr:PIG-L family deacetylase [Myxococcota bacterium]